MESKAHGRKSGQRKQNRTTLGEEQRQPNTKSRYPARPSAVGLEQAEREPDANARGLGWIAHLSKGTLSNDPMEIKVVQVDFAFKVYRSGETAAHISSAIWEGFGRGRWEERKGIRSVKSV